MKEMLAYKGTSFEGKTVAISGSGNVAIYACQKATQLGAKVVTMSDSNGFIYDPNGINLDAVSYTHLLAGNNSGNCVLKKVKRIFQLSSA